MTQMKHFITDLPAFAIVVRGNETSEYYYSKIEPVWKSIEIDLQRVDAVTPATLPEGPLKFGRNTLRKYTRLNPKGKAFTNTERAVWYSHYKLWCKCIDMDERILIMEHDCVPVFLEKLWYTDDLLFKSFDKGALGCYTITPEIAKMFKKHLEGNYIITMGPLGTLVNLVYTVENDKTNRRWNLIEGVDNRYDPGCTQIIHSKFGTTIQHYKGTEMETVKNLPQFGYYIQIDDLPNQLSVDILKANCRVLKHG